MYKISFGYLSLGSLVALALAVFSLSIYMLLLFFALVFFIYLRVRFTSIELKEDRLVYKTGILNKSQNEILFKKINNIEMSQNVLQSFFKVSNIKIYTGNDVPIEIPSVEKAEELKTHLDQKVQ